MGANEKKQAVGYAPEVADIREKYVYSRGNDGCREDESRTEFDRMIAKVRAEAKAEAWDEGFFDGRRQDAEGDDGPRFVNPYKEEQ